MSLFSQLLLVLDTVEGLGGSPSWSVLLFAWLSNLPRTFYDGVAAPTTLSLFSRRTNIDSCTNTCGRGSAERVGEVWDEKRGARYRMRTVSLVHRFGGSASPLPTPSLFDGIQTNRFDFCTIERMTCSVR